MDLNKKNSWFDEIAQPGNSTLKDSVGYLDRLIGGGSQKQFLFPQAKREPGKSNNSKLKQKNTEYKPKAQIKNKQGPVDLDDAKWIEERKKRFPKRSNELATSPEPRDTDTSDKTLDCDETKIDGSPVAEKTTHHIDEYLREEKVDKLDRGHNTTIPQRRKTLFEKLMELG